MDIKEHKEEYISKLEVCIASSYYLVDCLVLLNKIMKLPTCNECELASSCEYCPKPGEGVRYNCPHFVES